jgi:rod shape determining protein RodA
MMFDRRLVQCFDWGLLGITCLLAAAGLATLYSATTAGAMTVQKTLYLKQLTWYGAGLVIMTVCFVFHYKLLDRYGLILYGLTIALLLSVLLFGRYIAGSRRWLILGPVSMQPSEMAKLAVIIILARYYSRHLSPAGLTFRDLIQPVLLVVPVFLLIVKEPDLGTAMLIFLIAASMTLFVKVERRTLACITACGAAAIPVVWLFLKGYQKQRILTFLNPDRDPLGAGYHIIQSKIAIGSGMLLGKGYQQGTQNALSFLPEQHTDFIFSVLSEEWGFVGSAVVLLLFLLLIFWGLKIAQRSREPFGTILAFGITAMIFWEVFINIGMVMGLMPVVGVPLPFVSYGGSANITLMMSIGILLNISMRRFMYE